MGIFGGFFFAFFLGKNRSSGASRPKSTLQGAGLEQYIFEIVSQRGYRTRFALASQGIAQVSLRCPLRYDSVAL